ncbi:MAG: hypothetical protein HC805_03520 [Alkalinema sp. RL_2_19]|nr:hypothetical protein [Alkalinema sp. RL_2_19]
MSIYPRLDQNLEAIAQITEQAGQQMAETLDKEVSPWVEQLLQPLLDAPLDIDVDLDAAIAAVVQPWRQTIEPPLNHHPVCAGCKHYHGESYGGNLLVCGMYPFGLATDQATCPDKENVDWQEPWKTWFESSNQ